jgi:hypothetical protein
VPRRWYVLIRGTKNVQFYAGETGTIFSVTFGPRSRLIGFCMLSSAARRLKNCRSPRYRPWVYTSLYQANSSCVAGIEARIGRDRWTGANLMGVVSCRRRLNVWVAPPLPPQLSGSEGYNPRVWDNLA